MMREHDEIVKDIKTVLEEKVAPSVAAHNGAIGFINFCQRYWRGYFKIIRQLFRLRDV